MFNQKFIQIPSQTCSQCSQEQKIGSAQGSGYQGSSSWTKCLSLLGASHSGENLCHNEIPRSRNAVLQPLPGRILWDTLVMHRVDKITSAAGSWCDECESLRGSGDCQSEGGCALPAHLEWRTWRFCMRSACLAKSSRQMVRVGSAAFPETAQALPGFFWPWTVCQEVVVIVLSTQLCLEELELMKFCYFQRIVCLFLLSVLSFFCLLFLKW